MSIRFTDLDEVGPSRRGLRICPECLLRSLSHAEVDTRSVVACRGAVICSRLYECTSPGCGVLVRFYEVSAGVVTKRTNRAEPRDRVKLADQEAASVQVLPDRIILKI